VSALDLGPALEVAVAAAREAGDHLRRDFHRPGGPRGHGDKAEADTEAELLIRSRLLQAFPSWGYLGEETGRGPAPAAGAPIWLVDPNDGTRDYLEGRRGSAVSIGLVAGGLPVLGVVFAFAYPDDDGDLFVWAEGQGPLLRNGRPVAPAPATALRASDVVLVSSAGDRDPGGNLECVAPARFRTVPSIAHRLALVAAGEAAATSALFAPREWDYGAGHALLRAAGGSLLDETGEQVRYAEDGSSRTQWTLGGSPPAVEPLSRRPWASVRGGTWGKDRPARLARGEAVADSGRLSRAHGCLLGLVAGGNLGALASGSSPTARLSGRLEDGSLLAGQPTGAVETALALARSIVSRGSYSADTAVEAYRAWLESEPFDVDPVAPSVLADGSRPDRASSQALVRMIPLAIFAHGLGAEQAAEMGRRDCLLTGADPISAAAAGALVVAVAHAIAHGDGPPQGHGPHGDRPAGAHRAALDWARRAGVPQAVTDALTQAAAGPPGIVGRSTATAATVLHNAFSAVLHAEDVAPGVVAALQRGGESGVDAGVDAAIAGALLGAVHGRQAVPAQWRSMVLSCRPHPLRTAKPRPRIYWPTDVFELAERLLLAGMRHPR
jgi:fructose-1,6-bisphosphatase/inositol monophosphatase family enzyme/ADP-ribosylglycohydrolase